MSPALQHFLLGNLDWSALPHEWFTIGGTGAIILMVIAAAAYLTATKRWKWLWTNWLTSTDPKRIGIMYILLAALMFVRGGLDALMIWLQQTLSAGNAPGFLGATHGYLSASHFQQIFTSHGDIMVFFVTMGFFFGIMNLIVPLEIGARDLAYPFLNSLGFWLYAAGAVLINFFFMVGGQFAAAGWLSVPPLNEVAYSPGVGMDYWIWSLQISGLGSLLSGLNFLVTIIKLRAPGMTLMKMPIFVWSALCSMVLVLSAFPILTVTIALTWLDRFFGLHFFSSSFGGNPMMYINLIWMWGHPEVYILVIPAFGMFSEIVAAFSHKRIFGYASNVAALIGVTAISMLVWLHHFFTMGAGADVNAVFGVSTMIIAIPTAVLLFNWIMTMYRGRIAWHLPMYWLMGFFATFTFGGMAGMLLATPAADYVLHNTLFLVAHFHTMVVGAALFGIFAGVAYWFPKVTGFKINERIGRWSFWLWLVGFFTAFTPLYILGIMGAVRRMNNYPAATGYQPLFAMALVGGIIIATAFAVQIWQVIVSFRERRKPENMDTTGDPWDGRTLEWSTPSPVPFYSFPAAPVVHDRDAFWEAKKRGEATGGTHAPQKRYEDITLSRNTGMGIYISALAFLFGFAAAWHIIWLAVAAGLGIIACVISRSFDEDTEYVLPAAEVEKLELARLKAIN